jgi:transcription elongation factor GreB
MDKKNYITPDGHKRLVDELEQLMRKERPEVTALIQWAASNGDRSENADYLYGKKRLLEIDRRLRFLTSRIDMAQIVDPEKNQSSKVHNNS